LAPLAQATTALLHYVARYILVRQRDDGTFLESLGVAIPAVASTSVAERRWTEAAHS
jgi:hypothetical protein